MKLPELGVGIVYTPGLEDVLEARSDLITVVEVEPQTLWGYSPKDAMPYRPDLASLERLRSLPQTKLVHGVGFPVGGSKPPDSRHVPPLVKTIKELGVPWVSEHLGFNRATGSRGEFNTGFLLPPLQTPSGVKAAAASILQVASKLPVPFAIETGVNYLQPGRGELSDGAFVAAVVRTADCGILLDLHNIWTNEQNGRQEVKEFIREIPRERVWEIHLAGGIEYNGYWLDAHSGVVPERLIDLASEVIPLFPNVRAVVLEILPSYIPSMGLDTVVNELEKINQVWAQRNRTPTYSLSLSTAKRPEGTLAYGVADLEPSEWEHVLGALVVGRDIDGTLSTALEVDPGVEIIRKLVQVLRSSMIVDTLKLTCRVMMLQEGEAFLRQTLDKFFAISPPELFASAEAEVFGSYLDSQHIDIPYLSEVLAFERAAIRALVEGKNEVVKFPFEPTKLLQSLAEGHLPDMMTEGEYEVVITSEPDSHSNAMGLLFATT